MISAVNCGSGVYSGDTSPHCGRLPDVNAKVATMSRSVRLAGDPFIPNFMPALGQ